MSHILQIIAASPRWKAVYAVMDGTVITNDIACWGLITTSLSKDSDKENYQNIVGFDLCDGRLNNAEETSNFLGYLAPHEAVDTHHHYWKAAEEFLKRKTS